MVKARLKVTSRVGDPFVGPLRADGLPSFTLRSFRGQGEVDFGLQQVSVYEFQVPCFKRNGADPLYAALDRVNLGDTVDVELEFSYRLDKKTGKLGFGYQLVSIEVLTLTPA